MRRYGGLDVWRLLFFNCAFGKYFCFRSALGHKALRPREEYEVKFAEGVTLRVGCSKVLGKLAAVFDKSNS
jgi:hypothetical protein